jgi:hypothetical protein
MKPPKEVASHLSLSLRLANRSSDRLIVATRSQLDDPVVHVFDPRNPRPLLPEFFFVIGCHKPGKLVAVLVISGDDVSSHSLGGIAGAS